MASNPNPAQIPNGLWRLWEAVAGVIPGVRLGGIYANKSGYHNSVGANRISWPGDYSIRLPLDLTGPLGVARAVDFTMDDAQMKLRTGYLQRAALHPDDNRLDAVREFYGTLNGSTVYGLSHDAPGQAWYEVSSDDSHLWHIHNSIFTAFVNDWTALAPIVSVYKGVTWEQYLAGGGPTLAPGQTAIDEGDDEMNGILVETTGDGKSNSQVRAWIDPVLGPVYDNLIDNGKYSDAWVAMGFRRPAGGGLFKFDHLTQLGRDVSIARAEYYAALKKA